MASGNCRAHNTYPDGATPTAGPFTINDIDGRSTLIEVSTNETVVYLETDFLTHLTPAQAREVAAALIECADHIDRAAMTPADIARETDVRR